MQSSEFIKLRQSLGLSQRDFANVINKSRSYVFKVEHGCHHITPSAECEILTRIAQYKNENCVNFTPAENENLHSQTDFVPSELVEHLEVVQANNELLEQIRKDQEREIELKRAQGDQINKVLGLIKGMEDVVQARVKDIIDERTRTIVTVSRHQLYSQALVTIGAIESIINMVEEGVTKPTLFLRQLRSVRDQLKEMITQPKSRDK